MGSQLLCTVYCILQMWYSDSNQNAKSKVWDWSFKCGIESNNVVFNNTSVELNRTSVASNQTSVESNDTSVE